MACADGRRRRAALVALCASAVSGCAAPQPLREAAAATSDLARAAAGISDRRHEFAALFFEALAAASGGDAMSGTWLHGVDATPRPARSTMPGLRARFATRAPGTSVLIVPGLFGDCFESQSVPFGDGVERDAERSHTDAYRGYADLGLHTLRLVRLPGRGSVAHNAARVVEAIRAEARRPGVERIVLVAYSKGVADAMQALVLMHADGGVPRQLQALASVAGLVAGSVIVERFGPLYRTLAPRAAMLGCAPADGEELEGLTREQRAHWLATNPLPRQLRYFSIVAHAPLEEISPALRPFHDVLSEIDQRNDGQVLAVNALLPHSTLLAEVRSDHWGLTLPLERHPSLLVRQLATERRFPREALFRAIVWWSVAAGF